MRLVKEWLLTMLAGVVGGGVCLGLGIAAMRLVGMANPGLGAAIWIATMPIACFGAMLGGVLCGRWIDRGNGREDE